jgi:AraC-like DNA-binding protein
VVDDDMTVERGRLGTGCWQMVTRAAASELTSAVGRYSGYREDAGQPVRRREVAVAWVVLIIGLGEPLRITGQLDAGVGGQVVTSFVAGPGELPVLTEHAGTQHGIEIAMDPTAAFSLLGLPMSEVANRVVALDDLWGRRAVELNERLAGAPSWELRFDLLDQILTKSLGDGPQPDPHVVGAWRELQRVDGDIAIGDIQRATGWSRRRLADRFRAHVGLTPKVAARVLRFQRATELLVRPGPRSQASIALGCGYYDQAHLNREFRQMAGCTPSQYLAARFSDAPGTTA